MNTNGHHKPKASKEAKRLRKQSERNPGGNGVVKKPGNRRVKPVTGK